MWDMNVCIFSGRLGNNPQMRYTSEGKAVTSFNMAISLGRDAVMWQRVTVWGGQAETVNQYLGKGDQVFVTGYMKEDEWETESGDRRTMRNLVANNVTFGAKASGSSSGGNDDDIVDTGDGPVEKKPKADKKPKAKQQKPKEEEVPLFPF